MHTSRALGGITVSKNVRREIVLKVIAIILGQVILLISIRWTARQISPNLALGNRIRQKVDTYFLRGNRR
jgi:hypothetical protein